MTLSDSRFRWRSALVMVVFVFLGIHAVQWTLSLYLSKRMTPTARQLDAVLAALKADPRLSAAIPQFTRVVEGIASGCDLWKLEVIRNKDCNLLSIAIPIGTNRQESYIFIGNALRDPCALSVRLPVETSDYFACTSGTPTVPFQLRISVFEIHSTVGAGGGIRNEMLLIETYQLRGLRK